MMISHAFYLLKDDIIVLYFHSVKSIFQVTMKLLKSICNRKKIQEPKSLKIFAVLIYEELKNKEIKKRYF